MILSLVWCSVYCCVHTLVGGCKSLLSNKVQTFSNMFLLYYELKKAKIIVASSLLLWMKYAGFAFLISTYIQRERKREIERRWWRYSSRMGIIYNRHCDPFSSCSRDMKVISYVCYDKNKDLQKRPGAPGDKNCILAVFFLKDLYTVWHRLKVSCH